MSRAYHFDVAVKKHPHFTTTPHIVIYIQVKCRETIALCNDADLSKVITKKERKIERKKGRKNSSSTVTLSTQWQWLQVQYQSYKVNIWQI